MIDALLAFEGEVHRQVTDLAARADAAERELQLRTEAASAADSLLEEARKRAIEVTEQASLEARDLIMRAQRDIESLQLDSQRELITAFRQYLQQIETAQSTLLRIARRALSALVADVPETLESAAEGQYPAEAPVDETRTPAATSSVTREVQPRRGFPAKPRSASKPSQTDIEGEEAASPDQGGADPAITAVGAPADSDGTPSGARRVASRRRTSGKTLPGGQEGEPHRDEADQGGPSGSNGSQTDEAPVSDGHHNLIDLRNRRDLERLDSQNGPIMRAITRRRNGAIQEL